MSISFWHTYFLAYENDCFSICFIYLSSGVVVLSNMNLCDVTGGQIILFDRKMLRNFRKDGHNWKKKKDGKTVKEAHEHLKVRLLL